MSRTDVHLVKPLSCALTAAVTFIGGWWMVEFSDGSGSMDAKWWTLLAVGLLPVVVFGVAVTEPRAVRVAGLGMTGATAIGWLLCYLDRDDAMTFLSVMMGFGVAVAFVVYGVGASRAPVRQEP